MATTQTLTLPTGQKYSQPIGLFINNEFVPSASGKKFSANNPSLEEQIVEVFEADEKDVDIAVNAAGAAFKVWGKTDPTSRGKLLLKFADKLEEHAETLAAIESWNNGMTLFTARLFISNVINVVRNYGGWADKVYGDVIEDDVTHFNYTRREPIGVCGQIIAWNFPLMLWSWKIAPAIATGNTVVLKTAESTPLSVLYAANLFKEVGFPPGVMNILSGYGKVGAALSSHLKVHKIAFTGSTATGRLIMRAAATSNLKKVTLELGGKSPHIVFDDADLQKAAHQVVIGGFINSGEVCCSGSRIYVQEGIYDKFLEILKTMTETLKSGDPFDETSFFGPQTSQAQLDRVLNYVKEGKKEGARILTGGKRLNKKGYFIEPTVFVDVEEDMRIVKEEIFGPVITVSKFKDIDQVLELAHDTEYGLAAGIHTKSINRAIYTANNLNAGTVWVNTFGDLHHNVPFGGYLQSGIGREMGKEALDSYTQTKSVRFGDISAE